MSTGTLKIRLVRSPIGYSRRQKDTVRSLGFTRLQQIRELPDNGAVRGMVNAVCHLIEVVENDGDKSS
ncbi:MAG: 50S ribosomal protein L30 [Acidobacteria bacterium]|nr:50S ribosomal protein L30 [Acidobacteriota bacterium]MCZ6747147.1 50S ribosomal protein L30 [Acidobacteriota bacterium]